MNAGVFVGGRVSLLRPSAIFLVSRTVLVVLLVVVSKRQYDDLSYVWTRSIVVESDASFDAPRRKATSTQLSDAYAYYLEGKTKYQHKPFDDVRTYEDIENEAAQPQRPDDSSGNNVTTWILPHKLLHPTRNHDSIIVENGGPDGGRHLLINVLGRHSRHVQVTDLLTGEQWARSTEGKDPEGFALNDLNHVYTVLVDGIEGGGEGDSHSSRKELWLPCGFRGDRIKKEESIHYARILDLETLTIRVGPKLPYSGGACVALALKILPDEPDMICTFGGTVDTHDSGMFLPYSTCYDRVRERWWFPFGRLPVGLDHGSVAIVPAGTCETDDPARLLILNYRIRSFGTPPTEVLAFDLPANGWTLERLESSSMEGDRGGWYVYANITHGGPDDVTNCPRDASGTVTVNNGREILNFGGVFYDSQGGKFRSTRFSAIRSFDVCDKRWTLIGDLGVSTFALQTCSSQGLQVSITCGGEAKHRNYTGLNSPWCAVSHLGSTRIVENRSGGPAVGSFVDALLPGVAGRALHARH